MNSVEKFFSFSSISVLEYINRSMFQTATTTTWRFNVRWTLSTLLIDSFISINKSNTESEIDIVNDAFETNLQFCSDSCHSVSCKWIQSLKSVSFRLFSLWIKSSWVSKTIYEIVSLHVIDAFDSLWLFVGSKKRSIWRMKVQLLILLFEE